MGKIFMKQRKGVEVGKAPIILFGAFDRHNLGDLLFPHIAGALLKGREFVPAGLAERDLRAFGGHRVAALPELAAEWGDAPANLIHVGGEILTCDTWQAAVMLLSADEARAAIAAHDPDDAGRLAWARKLLGIPGLAAYTVPKKMFRRPGKFIYNGVGGVELAARAPAFRAEVAEKLRAADYVGVRDRITQGWLAQAGIEARLVPDPGVMVAELFGERIYRSGASGEPAEVMQSFPQGYVAAQFGADFGDDATLSIIAAQLDRIVAETGLGVAFFRAGAAPWHDDLACYRRVAARMRSKSARLFGSLNIWDICALVAGSRIYCGSSLHGRIVALAFAVPRVNILHPLQAAGNAPTKQGAFVQTWEAGNVPGVVRPEEMAEGVFRALAEDAAVRRKTASDLCMVYRKRFGQWSKLL
jgi:hypothetical protein